MPPSSQNPREAWSPSLRRCVRLFGDFRHEQDDPDRFYGALARDSVGQLGQYVDLDGVLMLDIGGGPGYFREAFEQAGATYIALDADVGEMSGAGDKSARRVVGDGVRRGGR